jgi:putative transposase
MYIELAGRLAARSDELVAKQMIALGQVRAYGEVPREDLVRSCRRNVARVVAVLEELEVLPPAIVEDERMSGRRRALQGVATEDVVEAYRLVLSVLRDAFIEEADRLGLDARQTLAGTVRLWELTDRYSNVLVAARAQVEIEAARQDERLRVAHLRRLILGADPASLGELSAPFGMGPDGRWWVVRGHQDDGEHQLLSQHLEASMPGPAAGFRPLVTPFDADVVAVSAKRPEPLPGAVIAVAGPVAVEQIARAFTEATRVLQAATRYRLTGIVDSSSLSVRVAVEQQRELGEQLHRRYVGAVLEPRGAAADDLLETVRAYLASRRAISATAGAMRLHQNTVRYRLERYQRLTRCDLSETDTLVELWWALEYDRVRRA